MINLNEEVNQELIEEYEKDIKKTLGELLPALEKSLETLDVEGFCRARSAAVRMNETLRELWQEKMRPTAEELIFRLKSGRKLSAKDIETLREWIVGDAEYYAKLENNFNDWISETKRLFTVVSPYKNSELSEKELRNLQAYLLDLQHVLDDVIRYLETKARLSRFEAALSKGIDKESAEELADLINLKLKSEKI